MEPLLDWKGDTIAAPSGSPDPEGSITLEQPVTSPSHRLPNTGNPVPGRVSTDARLSENSRQSSIVRAGNVRALSVSGVLSNNMYAALADEESSG